MTSNLQKLIVLLFLNPAGLKKKQLTSQLKLSTGELSALASATVKQTKPLGLSLLESSDSFKLIALHEVVNAIDQPVKPEELSAAALEVLTIIAYKEPITRPDIEELRGVGSDQTIRSLLERELISVSTSKQSGINYTYYRVTANFLQIVGIESLTDLPELNLDGAK